LKSSRVLVTGGAGFIGSHLVDALISQGHRVRVLDALVPQVHGSEAAPYLNPDAEFIRADVNDSAAVVGALEGIEYVFHEAAEVGVGQSMYEMQRYVRANTLGTAAVLEAIVSLRPQVKKVIVASSMSIYGEGAYRCPRCGVIYPQLRPVEQLAARRWEVECPACGAVAAIEPTAETKPLFPTSVYAITKQDQEQLVLSVCRAYKTSAVALRYFNVYGTRQALSNPYTGVCAIFSSRLLNDEAPIVFEDGQQVRDFVHVSDIVKANLLALESDDANDHAINIGTGVGTSVLEIARLIAAGLGKKIEPVIVAKYREGDIRHCVADISLARRRLGFAPQVSLQDGLPELLEWVRKQSAADRVLQATAELESRQLVR
jgi:dTDP-L-rhamnose 4-epimerase